MFYLSLIEHTLRLPPNLLNLPLEEAIKGELETLFLDKVISNLGLCISIYDIKSITGGFIFPGDGASTYTVVFRLVMFRPFVGEILVGKLKASDANVGDGRSINFGRTFGGETKVFLMRHACRHADVESVMAVSLGFFEDIYVPVHLLPNPSHLLPDPDNKNEVRWTWEFQDEQFPIDGKDEIRFRVHSISYPPIPIDQEKEAKPFAPMVITGSLDYDGLGPISWWV